MKTEPLLRLFDAQYSEFRQISILKDDVWVIFRFYKDQGSTLKERVEIWFERDSGFQPIGTEIEFLESEDDSYFRLRASRLVRELNGFSVYCRDFLDSLPPSSSELIQEDDSLGFFKDPDWIEGEHEIQPIVEVMSRDPGRCEPHKSTEF